MGIAPSTVAKSVARLEQAWQVRLFQRTTRTVRLTVDGTLLSERCRQLLADFDALAVQPACAQGTAGTLACCLSACARCWTDWL
ncbi:MAG: LysR family transcriptional regulator [Aquincola tertiaricarbonis]